MPQQLAARDSEELERETRIPKETIDSVIESATAML